MDASELLRRARVGAGMTLRELAARAKTSHSALAAYESGRVRPTLDTAQRIAAAAGFDLELRLVRAIDDPHRGQELWDVLELAAMFPARHDSELAYPKFPG